ncbi:MAG TPA: (2Fe-2S)-binding protein [Terriglobia bacterium]|nr:(2Fe-2S)-binding protein [Terriglobia bacterium]
MKKEKLRSRKKEEGNEGFNRRDFLKGAGVAVSGGILAGETQAVAQAAEETSGVQGPGETPVTLRVNGETKHLNIEPRVTLLDALRDRLDTTGAKRVCDRATCGACTMLVDDRPVYGCTVLAIEAQGHEVTTIEHFSQGGKLHPMMQAFVDHDAQQCGFCTPGFVMACIAFLKTHHNPTLEDVEKGLGGNLCRCGTYEGIRHAVLQAAKTMTAEKEGGLANG